MIAISSSIDSETSSTSLHQLEELTSLFDKYGVRHWLDSGTLLGVVREVFVLRELNDLGFRIKSSPFFSVKSPPVD